jgi:pantoate--beta-alanine ligase
MRTVRTVAALRETLAGARREGRRIGLVPTMGALHDGHLALVRAARERCDVVVVSLFVNPAQFDERTDLERYPRSEARDARLARGAGADILFAPSAEEVYPEGFATSVEVLGLTERLEGAVRGAGHFRGVTTVVTKLLGMVGPDVAFFGQKDAQQLAVIRRLVYDLNLPTAIEALPTVREPDGLALSSRNALLAPGDRERAVALVAGLEAAREAVRTGERSAEAIAAAARAAMAALDVEPEYVAFVDPDTFESLAEIGERGLLAVAARIGGVRLIDNEILQPDGAPRPASNPRGEAVSACSA